jgi:hypothetical protein
MNGDDIYTGFFFKMPAVYGNQKIARKNLRQCTVKFQARGILDNI